MKNISYERYIETFGILESRSEEYGHQLEHLLATTGDLADGFSILDIGAGKGAFAASFVRRSRTRPASYVAIEPSAEQRVKIGAHFAPLAVETDVRSERFAPETRLGAVFDLIIMSHSIYWFYEDIVAHIQNAIRHLKGGGRLVVYLQTFATFCYILNLFLRAADPPYPHRVSSREVQRLLDEAGIRCRIDYLPGALRADDLLSPGDEGHLNDLISFCLFAEAKELSPEDLKFAQDLLQLLSYEADGGRRLNLSLAAITISA